jgi:S1-C subfamily serine protease
MTNGAEDENAAAGEPSEQPTEPAQSTAPPPPDEGAAPSGAPPSRGGWLVPKWAVAALVGFVAVALLFGSGFGIGRATSSGGDERGPFERGFEGRFPGDPDDLPRVPREVSGVFLGVSTENATGDQEGARIASVEDSSPAAGAGLQEGDVITSVDGETVTSPADLAREIRSHEPGDQVTIAYTRDGNAAEAQVELAERSTEREPAS